MVSSTNKTDHHTITEIMKKVSLNLVDRYGISMSQITTDIFHFRNWHSNSGKFSLISFSWLCLVHPGLSCDIDNLFILSPAYDTRCMLEYDMNELSSSRLPVWLGI